jgi:tetratricopeptide (TPR) repeat protein
LLLFIIIGAGMTAAYMWASYHLGVARSAMEQYHTREAIPHLQAALSVWPHDPETLLLTARAARRAEVFDRADQYLDQYQAVRGVEDESLVLERALVQAERGDIESVSEYCQGLVKQDHPDTPLILESLSRGFLRAYRLHEADLCLKEWLRRESDNAQAHFVQAQLYNLQGRDLDAVVAYRRVLTIDPEMEDARLRLCVALLQLGSVEEVLPHLEYLKQRSPDDLMVQVYLARVYDRLGRSQEAEQVLDTVLERQPQLPAALAERGRLALQAGQNEQAEKWLREAVTLDPNDYPSQYQFVLCLERNGKQDELQKARARLQTIEDDLKRIRMITTIQMQQTPHDPDLHYQVGMIALRAKTTREALRWFQSALREDPNHAPTHKALMEYYESIGDFGRAREHRQKAGKDGSTAPRVENGKLP